jgi:LmbE family N-acetylglucosaminyl deacetylase
MASSQGRTATVSGTTGATRALNFSTLAGAAFTPQSGDLLFAVCFANFASANAATFTPPTGQGWTLLDANGDQSPDTTHHFAIYKKTWGAGNADSTTATFTVSGSLFTWGVVGFVERSPTGAWAATQVEASAVTVVGASPTATMTAPTATSGGPDRVLLRMYATADNNTPNTKSDASAAYIINGTQCNVNSTANGYSFGATYRDGMGAGAVGTATLSQTAQSADNYVAWTYILVPFQQLTKTGPVFGGNGVASSNFTVGLVADTFNGSETVTLSDGGAGGAFTPSVGSPGTGTCVVTPANAATGFTFTYTPAGLGTVTLTVTNAQSWINPSTSTYTALVTNNMMVISPHPDDDIIAFAGVTYRANNDGSTVRVVFTTNGDFGGLAAGGTRQGEGVAAQANLGTAEDHCIFLGYPDSYLQILHDTYPNSGDTYTAPSTSTNHTYGTRGLGSAEWHAYAHSGVHATYNWYNFVHDLAEVIGTFLPDTILTTSDWDTHESHKATFNAVTDALAIVAGTNPTYNPVLLETIVWDNTVGGAVTWPLATNPLTYQTAPAHLGSTDLVWNDSFRIDVLPSMRLPLSNAGYAALPNTKFTSLAAHSTQGGGTDPFLSLFLHADEVFWASRPLGAANPPVARAGSVQDAVQGTTVTLDGSGSHKPGGGSISYWWQQIAGPTATLSSATVASPTFTAPSTAATTAGWLAQELVFELRVSDDSGATWSAADTALVYLNNPRAIDLAPQATVTVSTGSTTAARAVDGVIDGTAGPTGAANEWVSTEGAGAWIRLTWATPQTIDRLVLFGRAAAAQLITAGSLSFSDAGSNVAVPTFTAFSATGGNVSMLPNVITLAAARTVTWVQFTVSTAAAGATAVGLMEFEAYSLGAPDLALTATATSSTAANPASAAIDNVFAWYPYGAGTNEWASSGGIGEWIQLTWGSAQTINRIVLWDRGNPNDWMQGATITFSDGSAPFYIPAIDNQARSCVFDFSARTVTWIRLTVTAVSALTSGVGLAEFEAYNMQSAAPPAATPAGFWLMMCR